jgi:hypothetical protein
MGNAFHIYGPFKVSKPRVGGKEGKEYQKEFWAECDSSYPKLSQAQGLYVLSVRNGTNFRPQYVGMTKRGFTKEVFNANNLVKILGDFSKDRGELCLHLLAKPNDANTGFYAASLKTLLWTEMFILLLCRRKNPDIANIMGMPFLEDAGVESITEIGSGKGSNVQTFRNVLGLNKFGMGKKKKPGRSKSTSNLSPNKESAPQPNTPAPDRPIAQFTATATQ